MALVVDVFVCVRGGVFRIDESFRQAAGEVGAVDVSHLRPLRLEIFLVLLRDWRYHRNPPHDGEPVALEPDELGRVVGHQPHRAHADVPQNLGADAVLAGVHGEAKLDVDLDGVVAVVLQVVGAELLAEPDAPAFVAAELYENAAAGLLDQLHRQVQLVAAIAAGGA